MDGQSALLRAARLPIAPSTAIRARARRVEEVRVGWTEVRVGEIESQLPTNHARFNVRAARGASVRAAPIARVRRARVAVGCSFSERRFFVARIGSRQHCHCGQSRLAARRRVVDVVDVVGQGQSVPEQPGLGRRAAGRVDECIWAIYIKVVVGATSPQLVCNWSELPPRIVRLACGWPGARRGGRPSLLFRCKLGRDRRCQVRRVAVAAAMLRDRFGSE